MYLSYYYLEGHPKIKGKQSCRKREILCYLSCLTQYPLEEHSSHSSHTRIDTELFFLMLEDTVYQNIKEVQLLLSFFHLSIKTATMAGVKGNFEPRIHTPSAFCLALSSQDLHHQTDLGKFSKCCFVLKQKEKPLRPFGGPVYCGTSSTNNKL